MRHECRWQQYPFKMGYVYRCLQYVYDMEYVYRWLQYPFKMGYMCRWLQYLYKLGFVCRSLQYPFKTEHVFRWLQYPFKMEQVCRWLYGVPLMSGMHADDCSSELAKSCPVLWKNTHTFVMLLGNCDKPSLQVMISWATASRRLQPLAPTMQWGVSILSQVMAEHDPTLQPGPEQKL